ncbi:MAG: J domain-containing protein [Legionella sp.]|jgi:hypothetical protein
MKSNLEENTSEINRILTAANDYEVLGLEEGAPTKEIVNAYRKLMLRYHPDKAPQNNKGLIDQLAKRINLAKENLTQKAQRILFKIIYSDEPLTAHLSFANSFHEFLQYTRNLALNGLIEMAVSRTARIIAHMNPSSTQEVVAADDTDFGMKIALSTLFGEVAHDADTFALGMTLAWIQAIAQDTESVFLNTFRAGYYENNVLKIYELAAYIHPLVNFNELRKKIEDRTVSDLFAANSSDKSLYMSTPVRMAWNYDSKTLLQILCKQLILSPNIPFLLYNTATKKNYFIGIVFADGLYKIFSPYTPTFAKDVQMLSSFTEEGLAAVLKSHFYSDNPNQSVSMAITSFKLRPVALKAHEKVLIESTAGLMSEENFKSYLIDEYLPNQTMNARKVLDSISKSKMKDVLKKIVQDNSACFTDDLFYEFIDEDIKQGFFFLSLEIASFSENEVIRRRYSSYFINQYLSNSYKFEQLEELLEAFAQKNCVLAAHLTDHNKYHNSFFENHIEEYIANPGIVLGLLKLGITLSQSQVARFLTAISGALKEYYAISHSNRFLYSVQKEALNASHKLIEMVQAMVNHSIPLYQPHGLPAQNYLSYALIYYGYQPIFHDLVVNQKIKLDTQDEAGKYLLNYCARDKIWGLVDFLIKNSAPFATGKHVSYKEVPSLHAWINQVTALDYLYSRVTPQEWRSLTIKQKDVFEVMLKKGQNTSEVFRFFQKDFANSVTKNFIPYARASLKNLKQLKSLIELSEVNCIPDHNPLMPSLLFNQEAYFTIQILNCHNLCQQMQDTPNILGMTEAKLDESISKIFTQELIKIREDKIGKIYYAVNATFADEIITRILPFHQLSYLRALKNQIRDASGYSDLGSIIDSVTDLYYKAKLEEDKAESNSRDIGLVYSTLDKEAYHNSFAKFFSKQPINGIKVQLDKQGRVVDYVLLPDPFFIQPEYIGLGSASPNRLFSKTERFLAELHELKGIIEQSTVLKFSPAPPLPKTHHYRPCVENTLKNWNKVAPSTLINMLFGFHTLLATPCSNREVTRFAKTKQQGLFARSFSNIASNYNTQSTLVLMCYVYLIFIDPHLESNKIRELSYEEYYDLTTLEHCVMSLHAQFHDVDADYKQSKEGVWLQSRLKELEKVIPMILKKNKATTNQLQQVRSTFDRITDILENIASAREYYTF